MTWPKIWNNTGTVQNFKEKKILRDKKDFVAENFSVFVNEKDSFKSNLPKLRITNIQKKFTTFDNPYFVAFCAAYCCTYLCGISTEHFNNKTSNLITSISKYHFYYHMTRFLRSPEKLETHMTDKQIEFVGKHIPVKYSWTWEFDQTKEIYWLWLKHKREHHITVKDWYSTKKRYGGQIGFHYLQCRGLMIIKLKFKIKV